MWIKTDFGYINTDNLVFIGINIHDQIIGKIGMSEHIIMYSGFKNKEEAEKQLERVIIWIKLGAQVTEEQEKEADAFWANLYIRKIDCQR